MRSLAQRSANASSDTARLIEESVNKSENGAIVCGQVSENLTDIVNRIEEITTVARDVDSSSNELATGISQLNTAVFEMDKVTQANAAFSEETASAATQFTTQAEVPRRNVSGLVNLLGDVSDEAKKQMQNRGGEPMLMQQSQHEAAAQIKSPNLKIKDSGDHSDFFGFQEPSSKKNGSESNITVDKSDSI